jgi:RNA 3'-terminal phosphate cyclase (ATP)
MEQTMIRIDGSMGEGGGQILRSSLSLSLVTGKPFCIENIRSKRERSGLLRQHLTGVLAAAEIGHAQVEGASLGSKELTFTPGEIRAGVHRFSVGTAGSGTLVFQTILPALMTASTPSEITIEGGTHNQQAPPFDFLQKTFLPILNRMGPNVDVRLERYGFYPAGGGRFIAAIQPCARLSPIELVERGEIFGRAVSSIVANLPRKIAEREVATALRLLNWDESLAEIIATQNSAGPGNIVQISLACEAVTELFSGFGRLATSAEAVASEAARAARKYLACRAVTSEHLTDQLLLPFALAGGGVFSAERLNPHARTNMQVISNFLPVEFATTEEEGRVLVEVKPRANVPHMPA